MVWPGDTLTCDGTIVRAEVRDGDSLVELELQARAGDEIVLKGWATFVVPASDLS
jgi:acyl-coenzyme A thioesterase PaaI-like protein